jgi:CubicO group peptidase (beta-lactamase class C family)
MALPLMRRCISRSKIFLEVFHDPHVVLTCSGSLLTELRLPIRPSGRARRWPARGRRYRPAPWRRGDSPRSSGSREWTRTIIHVHPLLRKAQLDGNERGRPPLLEHERRSIFMKFRATADEIAQLQDDAESLGITVSELVRDRALGRRHRSIENGPGESPQAVTVCPSAQPFGIASHSKSKH